MNLPHLKTCTGAGCLCHRILVHEAGHAVMAMVLNCPLRWATVVPDEDATGQVSLKPPTSTINVMVTLAGAAAELIGCGPLDGAEQDDMDSIAVLLDKPALEQMFQIVTALLGAHWTAVLALAEVLAERGTMSKSDISKAVGRHLHPMPHGEKWAKARVAL